MARQLDPDTGPAVRSEADSRNRVLRHRHAHPHRNRNAQRDHRRDHRHHGGHPATSSPVTQPVRTGRHRFREHGHSTDDQRISRADRDRHDFHQQRAHWRRPQRRKPDPQPQRRMAVESRRASWAHHHSGKRLHRHVHPGRRRRCDPARPPAAYTSPVLLVTVAAAI